jgi:hypothetical protein
VAPVPQATEFAADAVAPSALPVPAWPQANCAAAGAGTSAKTNIESAAAPAQDFIRLYIASVTTRGICALSSKMSADLDRSVGQACEGRMASSMLALIPRCAKVEGGGAPHINRSVEAKAMLVLGGCFFSKCCQIASRHASRVTGHAGST